MNPDKLFDYLDGTLSPEEREQVEEKLAADPQLQRQLAMARKIHKGMGGSREVIVAGDEPLTTNSRGAVIGRRLMAAFALLVMLNVLIGIAFIVGKHEKKGLGPNDAAIREQLASSLGAAAQSALPPPIIEADEIRLPALPEHVDNIASKVVASAEQCGGSAVKAPPTERGMIVVTEISSGRETEFRKLLVPLGAAIPAASAPPGGEPLAPNQKKIIQVRIGETI